MRTQYQNYISLLDPTFRSFPFAFPVIVKVTIGTNSFKNLLMQLLESIYPSITAENFTLM